MSTSFLVTMTTNQHVPLHINNCLGLVIGATGAYWTFKGQGKEYVKDESELK